MESDTKKDPDLLSSNLEVISLTGQDDAENFANCLKKITKMTVKDEISRGLKMMDKIQPLTSGFDISKFSPLLLPNGEVKEWMMTEVQKGNQDGLTIWSGLIRILSKFCRIFDKRQFFDLT